MPWILNCGTSTTNRRYCGPPEGKFPYTVVGTWDEARKWDDEDEARKFRDKLPINLQGSTAVDEIPELEWFYYQHGEYKEGKTPARTERNRQSMAQDLAWQRRQELKRMRDKASA